MQCLKEKGKTGIIFGKGFYFYYVSWFQMFMQNPNQINIFS